MQIIWLNIGPMTSALIIIKHWTSICMYVFVIIWIGLQCSCCRQHSDVITSVPHASIIVKHNQTKFRSLIQEDNKEAFLSNFHQICRDYRMHRRIFSWLWCGKHKSLLYQLCIDDFFLFFFLFQILFIYHVLVIYHCSSVSYVKGTFTLRSYLVYRVHIMVQFYPLKLHSLKDAKHSFIIYNTYL